MSDVAADKMYIAEHGSASAALHAPDATKASTLVPDVHQTAHVTSWHTNEGGTMLAAARHRPGTASNFMRPASAAVHTNSGHYDGHTANHSSSRAGQLAGQRRPASATAGSGAFTSSNAAMARLKAELAQLAAVGNVQLQSLHSNPEVRPAAVDASAALEAQVSGALAHSPAVAGEQKQAQQCCTGIASDVASC